jgi:hypothetical protein
MRAIFGLSEAYSESDVNACANSQQLQHEIINGLDEEHQEGGPFRRLLPIGAKMF